MSAELALVRAFAAQSPEEVARFIERVPAEDGALVLEALDAKNAAEVVARAVPLAGAAALAKLPTQLSGRILEASDPALVAEILMRMDRPSRAKVVNALPPELAQRMKTMMEYGPRRAGGRLDPRAPALPENMLVSEVFERLRAFPAGVLHYVYAVDSERRLTGVASMRELMLAAPETPLGSIAKRDPEALFAQDSLEVVARHAGWKQNHALPVVDRDRRFLGALRYSTFRAIETELGQAASGPDPDLTASALAELCAIGTSAMTRFLGSALTLDSPQREEPALPPPSSRRSVLPGAIR